MSIFCILSIFSVGKLVIFFSFWIFIHKGRQLFTLRQSGRIGQYNENVLILLDTTISKFLLLLFMFQTIISAATLKNYI